MDGLRLAVLFTFLYAVNGQQFLFDLGDGLYESTNGVLPTQVVPATGAAQAAPVGRRLCATDGTYYYTAGDSVLDSTGGVVVSTPNGEVIWGLACCCDTFSYTYSTASGDLILIFYESGADITVTHNLNENGDSAVVKCDPVLRIFVIVSSESVWIVDFDTLADISDKFDLLVRIAQPTCIACRATTNGYDIFVSSIGTDTIAVIQIISGVVTVQNFQLMLLGFPVTFHCLDLDEGNNLYVLTRVTGNYGIRLFSATLVANGNGGLGFPFGQLVNFSPNLGTHANGLSVCGTTCATFSCNFVTNCDCENGSPCGFCVGGSTVCQCDNALTPVCVYSNAADRAACEECLDLPDACLIVRNPLAMRKTGNVDVCGVMVGDGGTITVTRSVKIGRFGPVNWALPFGVTGVKTPYPGHTVGGFTAPATSSLRGSRFGVFWGAFTPSNPDELTVSIAAIVTENSGFRNELYTTTVNTGDPVALTAIMETQLLQFIPSLQWWFHKITQGTKVVSPRVQIACTGLVCNLVAVTKPANEGVYEVFRPRRQLRNWHPIFYLYVRPCPANTYGAGCMLTLRCSPGCVNGICDAICGGCVCYPGWMGPACDMPCSGLNMIGASCTTSCSAIFPGNTDCQGLLICKPAKLGCACRSGLKPPECMAPCVGDTWGPNCLKTCGCTPTQTCNPVLGCE